MSKKDKKAIIKEHVEEYIDLFNNKIKEDNFREFLISVFKDDEIFMQELKNRSVSIASILDEKKLSIIMRKIGESSPLDANFLEKTLFMKRALLVETERDGLTLTPELYEELINPVEKFIRNILSEDWKCAQLVSSEVFLNQDFTDSNTSVPKKMNDSGLDIINTSAVSVNRYNQFAEISAGQAKRIGSKLKQKKKNNPVISYDICAELAELYVLKDKKIFKKKLYDYLINIDINSFTTILFNLWDYTNMLKMENINCNDFRKEIQQTLKQISKQKGISPYDINNLRNKMGERGLKV